MLPAQNATGNWIKVVQRVPVRVKLDAAEVAAHPLRVGLSMDAKVDISKTDGRMLADASNAPRTRTTEVFDHDSAEADARVQRIIAGNGLARSGSAALANADVKREAAVRAAAIAPAPNVAESEPATASAHVALVN